MEIKVRAYTAQDVSEMMRIWNEVVEEGVAFPQMNLLEGAAGEAFFREQTYCAVAEEVSEGKILGLYILHPNNVGRCGHICNASFAVTRESRGLHIGEKLVKDCLKEGKALYERLGFVQLGTIPGGFLMKDGTYEDICPYYHVL